MIKTRETQETTYFSLSLSSQPSAFQPSSKPTIPAGLACPPMATILQAVIRDPGHSWCHHSILRKPLQHKTSCSGAGRRPALDLDVPARNSHERFCPAIEFSHVCVDFGFYGIIALLMSVWSPMMLLA